MGEELKKIELLVSDPFRSDYIDIISPTGVKFLKKQKPEKLEDFLNHILKQYNYPFVIIEHRRPNGTSSKKIGEIRFPGSARTPGVRPLAERQDVTGGAYPGGGSNHAFGHGYDDPHRGFPVAGNYGLQAPFPGLQDPKILVKAELFDEIKQERDKYKELYEQLRDKANELQKKLDILEIKNTVNSDAKTQETILEIISSFAGKFGESKANINPNTQGLNEPGQTEHLREIVRMLKDLGPQYHPEFYALIKMMIENPDFLKDIREVEAKYGLIKKTVKTTENE